MKFVRIPRGIFLYGESKTPTRIEENFEIGKYPVTVGEFREFISATGYDAGSRWLNPGFQQDDNHPVVCVNTQDAEAFCAWAGCRLPTEQEWEYAARGPEGKLYPWGDSEPKENLLHWSGEANKSGTCPVGTHPLGSSQFGIQDMAGNVWEWTNSNTDNYRVIRGGGWNNGSASWVRASLRDGRVPVFRDGNLGFRCARGVNPTLVDILGTPWV